VTTPQPFKGYEAMSGGGGSTVPPRRRSGILVALRSADAREIGLVASATQAAEGRKKDLCGVDRGWRLVGLAPTLRTSLHQIPRNTRREIEAMIAAPSHKDWLTELLQT